VIVEIACERASLRSEQERPETLWVGTRVGTGRGSRTARSAAVVDAVVRSAREASSWVEVASA
jgi:hypothetical protein